MSARGFRSISMVAGIAAAALGCYMVSLRVASERAALEDVENKIVLAQRDIRVLQTEIGTRGRLAQLESWNVKVLALSAPQANQFVDGGFQLASLVTPKKAIDPSAPPVVLASAPAPERKPRLSSDGPETAVEAKDLMHVASLKRDLPDAEDEKPAKVAKEVVPAVRPTADKPKKTVEKTPVAKPKEAAAPVKAAKSGADSKAAAKIEAKPAAAKPAASKSAPTKTTATKPTSKPAATKSASVKAASSKDSKAKQ